ncbi:hypothetical protein AG1IA_09778 [Rhizoctonia solani AG-1 IA]|uniref:Uncharacterized protein n=1 Tax=Thanatephorus cucumeris (strain AG1-IA) TaxID=983506 RepID=L8WHJ2_THACA|nr:hypothetical protein AG1IA_09778 [Rhizoctonia solani AG-1 IA]
MVSCIMSSNAEAWLTGVKRRVQMRVIRHKHGVAPATGYIGLHAHARLHFYSAPNGC